MTDVERASLGSPFLCLMKGGCCVVLALTSSANGASLGRMWRLANGAKGTQYGEDIVDADGAVVIEVSRTIGDTTKLAKHHQNVADPHGTVSCQICGTVAA